jgi:hypothetical protein
MEETPNTTRLTFSEILNKLTNAYLRIVAGIVRRLLHSFSGSLAHHKNQANQILLIRQIREGLYMTVYFLLQLEEQSTERLPGGCACAEASRDPSHYIRVPAFKIWEWSLRQARVNSTNQSEKPSFPKAVGSPPPVVLCLNIIQRTRSDNYNN